MGKQKDTGIVYGSAAIVVCAWLGFAISADQEPQARSQPRSVLGATIEAAGGAGRLSAVGGIRLEGFFEIYDEHGGTDGAHETVIVYPDRLRQSRTLAEGTLSRMLEGRRGLMSARGSTMDMPPEMVTELRSYLATRYLTVVRHLATAGEEAARSLGTRRVRGRMVEVFALTIGDVQMEIGIDPIRSRLVSLSTRDSGLVAGLAPDERYLQVFARFRSVDGVLVPMDVTSYLGDRLYSRREHGEVSLDPALELVAMPSPADSEPGGRSAD